MSRGVLGVVLVGVAVLGLVAAGGSEWSNAQYKCAFRLPDDQWKNTTEEKMGILKDGIVEFMSLSDFSVVSLTPYAFATGEQWKSEMTLKTVETTESMIRALSDRVWLIREDPRYVVNGVSGYKREIVSNEWNRLYRHHCRTQQKQYALQAPLHQPRKILWIEFPEFSENRRNFQDNRVRCSAFTHDAGQPAFRSRLFFRGNRSCPFSGDFRSAPMGDRIRPGRCGNPGRLAGPCGLAPARGCAPGDSGCACQNELAGETGRGLGSHAMVRRSSFSDPG